MSDERREDPFSNPDDPAAREREQRRREREEKRRQRVEREAEERAAEPPAEPPPPSPPAAARTPDEEFWDEQPEPEAPEPEPTRPEGEFDDFDFGDEGDPALAAGRAAGNGSTRRGGGGLLGALRRHPFRIFAVLAVLFVLWALNALFQPLHGDGGEPVRVQVPKGSSVSEVGDLLSAEGVIADSTLFQIRVTLAGKRSDLYAGSFTLAEGMSYGDAIEALSTPPPKTTRTVTIPEGYARPQATRLVAEDGVPGDYEKASVRSPFLNPAKYGGKGAKDLEGFLFPNTYELKPRAPAADLVELQVKDFKRQIKKVDMRYAKSKNLTVYDVLIIASMIEDEAGVHRQRKLVGSVIYNRLREGMPLGIDATIRFATGNYDEPLTESELAIDSPYNSRTNQGLPPGPINSPGLAAIRAAARPAETDFLFYVTDPNGCNELTFAATEREFEAAVAAYNRAREEAGGNAPHTCDE